MQNASLQLDAVVEKLKCLNDAVKLSCDKLYTSQCKKIKISQMCTQGEILAIHGDQKEVTISNLKEMFTRGLSILDDLNEEKIKLEKTIRRQSELVKEGSLTKDSEIHKEYKKTLSALDEEFAEKQMMVQTRKESRDAKKLKISLHFEEINKSSEEKEKHLLSLQETFQNLSKEVIELQQQHHLHQENLSSDDNSNSRKPDPNSKNGEPKDDNIIQLENEIKHLEKFNMELQGKNRSLISSKETMREKINLLEKSVQENEEQILLKSKEEEIYLKRFLSLLRISSSIPASGIIMANIYKSLHQRKTEDIEIKELLQGFSIDTLEGLDMLRDMQEMGIVKITQGKYIRCQDTLPPLPE